MKKNKNEKVTKQNKKNNYSKVEASMALLDSSNILFTLDEIEKVFPKVNKEEENSETKVEKSDVKLEKKDYTIIRQETGKLNELIGYKMQYDLFIWQLFFEKCHECEASFFIDDDLLDKAKKSNTTLPDITERDVKYRRVNKEVSDKLIEEYKKKKYDDYVKEINGETSEVEEIVKKPRWIYTIFSGSFILLSLINLFIDYTKLSDFVYLKPIVTTTLDAIAIVFIVLFLVHKKVYRIKKYQSKVKPSKSYEEWEKENCNSEEFINKTNLLKKNYLSLVKKEEEKMIEKIAILKEIKQRMMDLIPLYKDYYSEESVNNLVNVALDRKCDTIRKAVKLAKEKDYQYDYLSGEERIVHSLNFIETYKIYMNEYTNLPQEKKDELDKSLEINNIIYNYLSRIKFDKTTIESEPFILKIDE